MQKKDGHTCIRKLIAAFCNSANAPRNGAKKLTPSLTTYVKQCQVPCSISIAVMDKRETIRTVICEPTSTACVPASWLSKC